MEKLLVKWSLGTNSLGPSDAHEGEKSTSSLVKQMAWHFFGTKPFIPLTNDDLSSITLLPQNTF